MVNEAFLAPHRHRDHAHAHPVCHVVGIGEQSNTSGDVSIDQRRSPIDRIKERRPPVERVHQVSDAGGRPSEIEVDERGRSPIVEENVPGTVVLMRHQLRLLEQRNDPWRGNSRDAAPYRARGDGEAGDRPVKIADHRGQVDQHAISGGVVRKRLHWHVAFDEPKDFTARGVVAEWLRGRVEPVGVQMSQQRLDGGSERANRTPHGGPTRTTRVTPPTLRGTSAESTPPTLRP
jgi:hypothetical protein